MGRRTGGGCAPGDSGQVAFPHSTRYVWYVILLLCVVNLCNYVDRMALAMLAPLIKADMDLTDGQLGLLTGLAFSLFYAVCALPIARWADRGSRRNIIALALTAWSAMTALSGAAQNFWHLFLARMGVGAGEAGSFAPGASILCDYIPLERRSGALGIHAFGNAAGILLGMALAGWLGATLGWRWTFVVLGLPGLALAAVVRFTLREPRRGFFDARTDEPRDVSLMATLAFLLRCRTYRLLVIFLVANGFVQFGLNQWWPSYYARTLGAELSEIGVYLGIAMGASMGMGMLIGGFMANRAAAREVSLPLRIGAVTTVLSIPTAVGSLFVPSLTGSIVLVGITGLFWGVSNGPVLASKYNVITSRMRATGGAVAIFFISLFGFGLGPFLVGVLSDLLVPTLGVESLRYALLLPVCVTPVMIFALLAAARTLPSDLRAIGEPVEDGSMSTAARRAAVVR